ncbi:MAG: hypothetical protein ACE5DN_07510, partial [Flavobacteriales bacterium]
ATVTMAGGSIGVVVFYYAGEGIYLWWRRFRLKRNKIPKKFTKRNRIIVRYKNKLGALGFAACLGFLSVPLCALVASRYFYHNKNTILYLIGSVIVWTFFLSGFSYLIRFILT